MKRTAKILAIVLTVVLAFGAIAIVSSAEDVTGINVTKSATYEGLDANYTIDATAGNPAGTGYDWSFSGRTGTVSVGLSGDDSGNKYLIYQQSPKVGSSGPYFGTGYGGKGTAGLANKTQRPTYSADTKTLSTNGTDIAEWPYLIFDFDIMAPTASWQGAVTLELRGFMADGNTGLDSLYCGPSTQSPLVFATDEGGTYLQDADSVKANKMYVNPYEFTHVTMIWQSVATETSRSVNLYVYVNGEFFFNYDGTAMPTNSGGTAYTGFIDDIPHMSYDEIRMNWPASENANNKTAYDNVVTRLFDKTYTGNIETVLAAKNNLDAWDSNLYSEETTPFGVAVAQVGDTKYDNLAEAIEAVPENGTVTLLANVAAPVTVSKIVTINAGEFTAEIVGGEGYAVDTTTEGYYKVINSAGQTVMIFFDECYCDDPCEDLSVKHPLNHFVDEAAIFTNILDLYNPTYTGFVGDDGVIYTFVGWMNSATGEMVTEDTVVTEADVSEGFLDFTAQYEVAKLDMTYVKGGELVYVASDSGFTLKNAIGAADVGSTVTLLKDIDYNGSVIELAKAVTLDLNGYTLKQMSTGKNVRNAVFKLNSGADITVTSSKVGGKIFCNGFNASGAGSMGIFNVNNNNTKVNLIGADAEGNTTLTTFSSVLVYGYSTTCEVNIDGGMYIGKGSDNMGFIDLRRAGAAANIKNAFIYTEHGSGLVCYSGRDAKTDDDAVVTIDNCVLIAKNGVIRSLVSPVVVKITNSYLHGDVTPELNKNYTSNTVGSVILGEGVYINGKTNNYVTIEDGYTLYDAPAEKEVSYVTNAWSIDKTAGDAGWKYLDASFDLTNFNETLVFAQQTSNVTPITVIWNDANGNEIGRNVALPGTKAVAPTDMKTAGTLIPGWLDYIPAEWDKDLTVPTDVSEYVLTAVEGGEVVPVANVNLLFNIRLTTHFEYHLFIPEMVEGIEVTAVDFRGDRLARYTGFLGTKYTINGAKYTMVDAWPGFQNGAAENSSLGVTFTYGGKTYSVSATINIPTYCRYILETEGYSDEAKDLAANTANYLYKGLVVLGKTSIADGFADLINNNTSRLITPAAEELVVPDLTALAPYVASTTLYIESYSPHFRLNLTEEGKAATISVSCGATSATNGQAKYSATGYIDTNQTVIQNLKAVTVTVDLPEGEEDIVVDITLAGYVALLTAQGADANTIALATAMYGYASANDAY